MSYVEKSGYRELHWDWARIQRNPQGLDGAWAASSALVTTAVNYGKFCLVQNGLTPAYIRRISINSSAATYCYIVTTNDGGAYPAITPVKLGNTINGPAWTFKASAGATVAFVAQIDEFKLAANTYVTPWTNDYLCLNGSNLGIIFPSLAATVCCSIWWTEYDD